MSLFNRRSLLVALTLPLTMALGACNFTPVYGPGGSGSVIQDQITLQAPTTRIQFVFVAHVEDRLGTGGAYTLDYSLGTSQRNVVVDGTERVNRISLTGTLAFTVRDAATGAAVQSGSLSSFAAYETSLSPVATEAALRNAEERLAVILGDQLITRLLSSAQTW